MFFIIVTWVVFKKKKRMAISISVLLAAGLAASYFYYPVYKANEHAKRHEVMMNYLRENYPGETFNVSREVYEPGVIVGSFDIAYADTPEIGVTMQVERDGQVFQRSTWTDDSTPEQEELWQDLLFFYGEEYTLDKQLPELKKVDQYIDGKLTVFALDINDQPAIAVYEYDQNSYGLLALEEGQKDEFVQIESGGQLFIYADEDIEENKIDLLNSNDPLNISDQKGKLIIHKNKEG
nr:hypothetical protein [Jeotgalibacillus malaysiensis]